MTTKAITMLDDITYIFGYFFTSFCISLGNFKTFFKVNFFTASGLDPGPLAGHSLRHFCPVSLFLIYLG